MTIERTPALAALESQIASVPLKSDAKEKPPAHSQDKQWRDKKTAQGGGISSVVFTPEAKARLEELKAAEPAFAGYESQSKLISAAVLAFGKQVDELPPALDEKALNAIAWIRCEFPKMESDQEAVSFAVRWFAKFVKEEDIESIDLGDDS